MTSFSLCCIECGARYEEDRERMVCDDCAYEQEAGGPIRGVLEVELEELPPPGRCIHLPAASFSSRSSR